jgi:hypothetical protein
VSLRLPQGQLLREDDFEGRSVAAAGRRGAAKKQKYFRKQFAMLHVRMEPVVCGVCSNGGICGYAVCKARQEAGGQ